jgi:site-specific DNA-methyltransferase (adenine-specific)
MEQYLNQIILGDCLEVMQEMPGKSIDLVVTSPPYNMSGGVSLRKNTERGKWKNAALQDGYDAHSDNMPYEEYVQWQIECLNEMMRLIKPTGAIFYNHKWRIQEGLLQDRHDIVSTFPVRQIIIWQRSGGINASKSFFLPTYEVIYLITKEGFRLKDGAYAHTDIWKITQARDINHPAPFPVELPRRAISSTDAQVILDPFMGSGSTALAAKELNRDFVGIEVSPKYRELALSRLACGDMDMFEH